MSSRRTSSIARAATDLNGFSSIPAPPSEWRHPLMPRDQVGFRIQLTSANTDEQVDHLCDVLGELAERFQVATRDDSE